MSNSEELPTQHTTSLKTILIVEDDPSIGEMFVQTLADENIYKLLLVTNGIQALEIVKETTPDLLLLDYHLPNMTGLELYDHIHMLPHLSRIPAILITAGVLQHDIQDRHMVGMSKPVDINKLLDIIAELLD
jgi:CheY-like chemotaxis protein